MLIGELARALGVPPETVRFYERRRLLPAPERASNGYRRYSDAALHRLRFIRTAQTAGLTLAEIRSIIDLRDEGTVPCSHVGELLETKLADIRQRQAHLAALEVELDQLLQRSRSLDPADCGDDDVCHILNTRIEPTTRAHTDGSDHDPGASPASTARRSSASTSPPSPSRSAPAPTRRPATSPAPV